jgi:formimidoylglutamate deiminase
MPNPPTAPQVLEAELTWLAGRFEPGLQVAVDAAGRITAVGRLGLAPTRTLPGRALLPGFVNAHSHCFQRGLRGRGESFPAGAGSFWTWREAMYELAGSLDRASLRALAFQAFQEMRRAGITTVGEFHYLHHERPGDFAFDEVLLDAAAAVGIRLVLLHAYYQTGGIGRPLEKHQKRFEVPDPATYWRQLEALAPRLGPHQTLGAVAHSVRAAPPEVIAELFAEASRRGLVFHLHVEEQRQEIRDCREAYGLGPLALLLARGVASPAVTAVHGTHSVPTDLERYLGQGARLCLCPTTEANLGDGIPDLPAMLGHPEQLCLGSDSNARISMLEEMRWLEHAQRLARERRGIVVDPQGEVAPQLLAIATAGGAQALGVPAGAIAVGAWADFALVDLGAPSLAGANADSLAAALVFGCDNEVVLETAVAGRFVEHRKPG